MVSLVSLNFSKKHGSSPVSTINIYPCNVDKRNYHDQDLIIEEALAAVMRLGINAHIEPWEPKINSGLADVRIVLQLKGKKARYTAEVRRGLRSTTLGSHWKLAAIEEWEVKTRAFS